MELLPPHSLISTRSSALLNAFALWEECVAEAEERFRSFDGQKLAVRVEDLVAEPSEVLPTIARFVGRTFNDATLEAGVVQPRKDRGYGFRDDQALYAF